VWWIGNLYDSLARWSIPVFLMLSGAFLVDEAAGAAPGPFLLHRFRRIGIPFLFWSAVYFAWNIEMNGQDTPYRSFLLVIARRPAYYHLWFLYVLMGLYLLAPLLGAYTVAASRSNIVYLLLLWFLFGSLVPAIESYAGLSIAFMTSAPASVFRYIGYFLLGHLLRATRWPCGRCITLFLAGYAVTALGTYFVTVVRNRGSFGGVFYEYYSPNVLLMSVALFVFFRSAAGMDVGGLRSHGMRTVRFTAACVPGIYLVHALLIAALKRGMAGIVLDQYMSHPAMGVPFFALVVFALSLGIVGLIRAVPVVRRIVP
jgi:surface polysaccharide O-acyltransferase-like enzyme